MNEPYPSSAASAGLRKADLDPDPLRQFHQWFTRALEAGVPEPTAMTLATASRSGMPSARIVLLKNYDERGFSFFTNYHSRKGRELEENPRAALAFFWPALERQIRLCGPVERVSREESDTYFKSRPRGARIGAWASQQSELLPSRTFFDQQIDELERQFGDREIPLPPHWGGYRLTPQSYEFWQARPSRLHDRFLYTPAGGNQWTLARLAP